MKILSIKLKIHIEICKSISNQFYLKMNILWKGMIYIYRYRSIDIYLPNSYIGNENI